MVQEVNHPSHYNKEGSKECIVEMREILGDWITAAFCIGNAFKYRYRAGLKGDANIDSQKADWYDTYKNEMNLEFTPDELIKCLTTLGIVKAEDISVKYSDENTIKEGDLSE